MKGGLQTAECLQAVRGFQRAGGLSRRWGGRPGNSVSKIISYGMINSAFGGTTAPFSSNSKHCLLVGLAAVLLVNLLPASHIRCLKQGILQLGSSPAGRGVSHLKNVFCYHRELVPTT